MGHSRTDKEQTLLVRPGSEGEEGSKGLYLLKEIFYFIDFWMLSKFSILPCLPIANERINLVIFELLFILNN